jgi:hypothetical protein
LSRHQIFDLFFLVVVGAPELVVVDPVVVDPVVVEPATVTDDGVCVDGDSSSDEGISFDKGWSGDLYKLETVVNVIV